MPEVRRCEGQTSAAYGPTMAKPPSAKKNVMASSSQNADTPMNKDVLFEPRHDGHDSRAEAQQTARVAPPHQLREEREREPSDEAEHGKQDHHLGGLLRRHLEQDYEQ